LRCFEGALRSFFKKKFWKEQEGEKGLFDPNLRAGAIEIDTLE
jgi:hypothetical protein